MRGYIIPNDAIVDVTFYTRSSQIAIKHTGDIDACVMQC